MVAINVAYRGVDPLTRKFPVGKWADGKIHHHIFSCWTVYTTKSEADKEASISKEMGLLTRIVGGKINIDGRQTKVYFLYLYGEM